MGKAKGTPTEPVGVEDLTEAIRAIAQAAQAQAASAAQIMRLMEQMAQAMQLAQAGRGGEPAAPVASQIAIWEDDPYSEASATANPSLAPTIAVAAPVINHPLLETRISDPAVPPGVYAPGTANFRYWVAAEALARGINFWAPLLPAGTRWKTFAVPMRVALVAGQELNAYYGRVFGLRFYQQVVQGVAVSTAESADVVCHELGHAVLDALRPQLFDAASLEAAAFHEAFGDMSAILCALQLAPLRQKVLTETQGRLNRNSRLSRVAEQLGWGIRQRSPSAVDRDCLRNAANRFFYQDPRLLPPSAPAAQLSSQAHSFSRVFTGAFLDALARMFAANGPADAGLVRTSQDMGRLLVNGIVAAPIQPGYYSQVAAGMLQVDRTLFQGRYRTALSTSFVQHGILTLGAAAGFAAAGLAAAPDGEPGGADDAPQTTAADAPALPTRVVATGLGIAVTVHAPAEVQGFAVASAAPGDTSARTADDDAAAFVEDLLQLGYIDMEPVAGAAAGMASLPLASDSSSETRTTHTLVRTEEGVVLKRRHFACGPRG